MQEVGLLFGPQPALNAILQLFKLAVIRQQIAQVNALLTEQAQVQITDGGNPQSVAASTEIFFVRHD
ncbi:hypothetical protein D3C78_1854110 [compost metagenome]